MARPQFKLDVRLSVLYDMAAEEDVTLNSDSVQQMDSFLESESVTPDHFNFTDAGYLYCTWKDPKTENWMEIEFHGNDKCKVFKFQKTEDSIFIVPDIDLVDINAAKEMLTEFATYN